MTPRDDATVSFFEAMGWFGVPDIMIVTSSDVVACKLGQPTAHRFPLLTIGGRDTTLITYFNTSIVP